MRKCLILAALLVTSAYAGPAYRWVDENGQVHYSDRPRPGAEEIVLPESPAPRPQPVRTAASSTPSPEPAEASSGYERLTITSPAAQSTLWNIGGTVDVSVSVQPALASEHQLRVVLDGELLETRPGGPRFSIDDVFRGMHSLEVLIQDASGNELIRSDAVPFMVQQTSIQNPNNPNRPNAAAP